MELNIIYEDNHIIVCEKPMMIASQGDRSFDIDMVSALKNYLSEKGIREPYIAPVHRLDKPVNGVMVYAKTQYAAKELSSEISRNEFHKYYYAVVSGEIDKSGTYTDYLLKDGRTNSSRVVSEGTKEAKKAVLNYEPIKVIEKDNNMYTLVRVELITGRHHQIRVQFASAGHGLYGDVKYNKDFENVRGTQMGLCAYRLDFKHPKTKKLMSYSINPKAQIFAEFDLNKN